MIANDHSQANTYSADLLRVWLGITHSQISDHTMNVKGQDIT